ncbi:mucin-2-like [Ranitomeya imitator]|uniref:mucin-2-like n=1 Tax=Ranitomeya imitator TaxID=111125 RepID=UPI0037E862D3
MTANILLMLVILGLGSRVQASISSISTVMASCTTTAKDLPGSSADVLCPADCLTKGGSVWGTDVYTNDSSICRAAIHAGKIPNDGGQVSVHKTPGEASYNGSTRNGISTKNFGKWPGSFIFVTSTSTVTPEPTEGITQRLPVMASCTTTAKDLPGSSADVLCPADCLTNGASVWGTDVYTNDSSICRAAIHAGKIPNDGGQVSVHKTPGEASYNGSTRNGISTKNFGKWPGSFIFDTLTSTVTPEPTEGITQRLPVMASCTTTAKDLPGSSADVLCPADCLTNGGSVWGTDVYTNDSSICRAAIHAGKIPNDGGQVSVHKTPGEASYNGSTRNGISTKNFGKWPGSFIFVTSTSTVTPEPTGGITQRLPVMASCTTTAKDLPGSSADVLCPADCLTNGASVWGTDVYTNDSSICRAAIHAGKIPNDGGQVSVHKTPGEASYTGSTRNGISTKNFGKWPGSFIFVTSTSTVTPEPTEGITQRLPVMASCTTTAKDLPGSSADVLCPADCLTNGGSVWGTDVYTNDSSICRAAIHAGKIPNDGGQVTVHKTPGEASYTGSTRNGISTKNFGAWPGSFIFVTSTSTVTPEPTEAVAQGPPVTVSCTTTARDLPGSSADVLCPGDCLANSKSVWGIDVYTDDSSICRAAIHAGIITNDGGQVSVQKTPGQDSYNGSTRNGITTKSYGAFSGSFIFVVSTSPATPEPTKEITQRTPVMASCTTTAKDLPGSSADVLCPADCLTNGGSVWGTDVYTNDSSICRAAIHAGKIPNDGGQITVHKTPGEASYTGSTRNGISTKNFGAWPGSFTFVTSTSTVTLTPEPTEGITQRPPVKASCSTTASDLRELFTNVRCPPGCFGNKSLWGTNIYADVSSICRAGIHCGILTINGGRMKVRKKPGLPLYRGSTKNGITSSGYGAWPGSFVLHKARYLD